MKKTICLLLSLCCLLVLNGCEQTPGRETLPPAKETTQQTHPATAPPETTATLITKDIPYLLIQDRIHDVDPETEGTVIHSSHLDPSGLVSATHIRFFTELSELGPYRDGVLPVCTDEYEMKSNSHYQCYAVEDGQLKKLENRTFAKEVSFLDGKTHLEFQYAVNGDKVILTYDPRFYDDNGHPVYSRVLDTSRGLKECLVYLTYFTEKDGKLELIQYFDFLDLETGDFTGRFADFDPAVFQNADSRDFVGWTEDGNPVFYEGDSYELFDMSANTVIEDYAYLDQGLTYNDIYADGKSYLEVTDPRNGETVLLKTPEGWDEREISWCLSPDGRKLRTWKYGNLLIYDGDRNMWIEIRRELPSGIREDMCFWTRDNEILLVSTDRRNVSVYRIAPE